MMKLFSLGVGVLTLLVSGCSSQFSCNQYPSTGCQPVSYVYESMNDGFYDYRKDFANTKKAQTNKNINLGRQEQGSDFVNSNSGVVLNIESADNAIHYPNAGDPLLSKPVVARILITDYETDQGDYVEGGYVYIKVKDSVWLQRN